jgi:hypothetical protein
MLHMDLRFLKFCNEGGWWCFLWTEICNTVFYGIEVLRLAVYFLCILIIQYNLAIGTIIAVKYLCILLKNFLWNFVRRVFLCLILILSCQVFCLCKLVYVRNFEVQPTSMFLPIQDVSGLNLCPRTSLKGFSFFSLLPSKD